MMRKDCIFCAQPLDGSDEHVIPDSLNGKLHTKKLICKKCNQRFGEHLDPILKETLFMQLHLFGFENAKFFMIMDDDGNKFKVDHSGSIHPVNVKVNQFKQDGMPGIAVSGKAEDAAEAFVKKMIRTFGKEETKHAALNRHFQLIEKQVVPNVLVGENPLKLTPKLLLALEKIVIEFYAHCGLDTSVIQERLDVVYQLDESRANMTICNQHQEVRKPDKDETSHLLLIRSRPDTREVYAYIELFNVICAYAILQTDYAGPALDFSYYQDVADGTRLEKEIILATEYLAPSTGGFELLGNDLVSRKRDKEMMKYLEANIQAIIDPLEKRFKAGEITEAECGRMVMEQAAEMTGVMTLLYPDDFSDLPEESVKRGNYFHSRIYTAHRQEFETNYQPLIGQEIKIDDDKRTWTLTRFHFVLAPPRAGRERDTVYCHFKTKTGGHEKEIKYFEVFRAFRLTFPETAIWL